MSFVKEELEGSGSILDTLKKEKLRTYINSNKIVKVKVDNKDVQIWIILIAICLRKIYSGCFYAQHNLCCRSEFCYTMFLTNIIFIRSFVILAGFEWFDYA